MREKAPKASKKVGNSPYSHCKESYRSSKLHSCNIYSDCLGQFHTGSLLISSVSVSPYQPRLVELAEFLVLSLTPLAPKILKIWNYFRALQFDSFCIAIASQCDDVEELLLFDEYKPEGFSMTDIALLYINLLLFRYYYWKILLL